MKTDQRLEFLLEPLEIYIRATRDFYSNEKLNRPSPSCIKSIVPPYRFSSPFSPSIFSSPTFSPIFLSHFLPRRNIYPTFYTSNGLKTHGGVCIRQVSVHTHLIQKIYIRSRVKLLTAKIHPFQISPTIFETLENGGRGERLGSDLFGRERQVFCPLCVPARVQSEIAGQSSEVISYRFNHASGHA